MGERMSKSDVQKKEDDVAKNNWEKWCSKKFYSCEFNPTLESAHDDNNINEKQLRNCFLCSNKIKQQVATRGSSSFRPSSKTTRSTTTRTPQLSSPSSQVVPAMPSLQLNPTESSSSSSSSRRQL